MKNLITALPLLYILLFSATHVHAQDVQIKLGNTEISSDEAFTISVISSTNDMQITSPFPEIKDMKKGTPSLRQSSGTQYVNGVRTSYTMVSTTQTYYPTQIGTFTLKPFTIVVNGKKVRSPGATITVKKASANKKDPFNLFFGGDNTLKLELQNMDDSKDGAFLALSASKDEVYVGEGLLVTLAFYIPISEKDKFHIRGNVESISNQLSKIEPQLKPAHCWEEDFNISRLVDEREVINDRLYSRYKLFQAMYFPLNEEEIVLPKVSLKMLKYNPAHARGQYFYGPEGTKTFYTTEKRIQVKALPPHPLKDQVNVGEYQLEETLSSNQVQTGESFQYQFLVKGKGNIASIKSPPVADTKELVIYEGNVNQEINQLRGTVYGGRLFEYDIEALEPNSYQMSDYFSWIFFNPVSEKYDTLRATSTILAEGVSRKNIDIASNDLGSFYDNLLQADNHLQGSADTNWLTITTNVLIVLLFGGMVWLIVQKRQEEEEPEDSVVF